jgi:hypothetical protein
MTTALCNLRGRSLHILRKILRHRGVEFSKVRRYSQSITAPKDRRFHSDEDAVTVIKSAFRKLALGAGHAS